MWGCCFQAGLHCIFFLSVVDYRLSGLGFGCRVSGLVVRYSCLSLFVGCRLSSILTIGFCRADPIGGCCLSGVGWWLSVSTVVAHCFRPSILFFLFFNDRQRSRFHSRSVLSYYDKCTQILKSDLVRWNGTILFHAAISLNIYLIWS